MDSIPPNRSWGPELDRRARALRWLVLDVDGVLTDGRLHIGLDGEVYKSFHVRDGMAIVLARAAGLEVAVLSARSSEIVARRAAELGVEEILQGHDNKTEAFLDLLERRGVDASEAAYVGDDLQDLGVLRRAGLAAAPGDATAEARDAAHYVTAAGGGSGAVRELVERLLVARGVWESVVARYRDETAPDAPAD